MFCCMQNVFLVKKEDHMSHTADSVIVGIACYIALHSIFKFNSDHMWLTCRNLFGNVLYSVLTKENALYT